MTELFVMLTWAARYLAAHIAFAPRRVKLAPVMHALRQGPIPSALAAAVFSLLAFAPAGQAHGVPAPAAGGSNVPTRVIESTRYDGISLDQAVRMAESQFNARVVRTEVQDEDGRKVYVLKLLSEGGRVITVRVDAATGRMR